MRLIDGDALYEEVQHSEELATNRVLDMGTISPYPNNFNLSYIRDVVQMNERTRFKYMIADAPTIEPEQRWIPCEEKLPEPLEKVLVTFEEYGERYVTIGYTNWYRNVLMWNLPYGGKAIAWQPRPKPYKE